MKLSDNFSLNELTTTSISAPNNPSDTHKDKLLYLAQYILQPIRDEFGPVQVNSGYRSRGVNLAIGGSTTSQHCLGEAADIRTSQADLLEVFLWILDNLKFGQCIFEEKGSAKWIHISMPRLGKTNQQAMIFKSGRYSNYKR